MPTKPNYGATPNTVDYPLRLLRGTNLPVRLLSNPYSQVLSQTQTNTVYPSYTARYTAALLSGSANYPFVDDPVRLLGSNQPMVLEALPKTATLYVPDLQIATDVDRDGVVDFNSRTDRTSTNAPFTFWVNDDVDYGSDDTAVDYNPSEYLADCRDSTIVGLRDLEDFARLQFRIHGLPSAFMNGAGLQTRVYLTNLAGTPSIRLFPAAETSGGIGYLTNTSTATTQAGKATYGVLTNGTQLTIGNTAWASAGSNRFFLPMIFEGVTTGRCAIVFGLASNTGPVLAWSRPFYLDLKKVTDLYEHWTVGDNITSEWNQVPPAATRTSDSAVFGAPRSNDESDYVLFVHGWRVRPWERRAFASTAFKRLWHSGYRGKFGLYSWPTDYTETDVISLLADLRNYDRSERRAWWSAAGLGRLLTQLDSAYSGRVRLYSHSMGGIPSSEALRMRGNSTRSSRPLVHSYVPSQAASVAHAYDAFGPETKYPRGVPNLYASFPRQGTNAPYFKNLKRAVSSEPLTGNTRTCNFHNFQDYALADADVWPANQTMKPLLNELKYYSASASWVGYPREWHYHLPEDAFVIFAYLAPAHSPALGASVYSSFRTGAEIGNGQDLNAAPIGFTGARWDHSAQFNSTVHRRLVYWRVLRQQVGLQ